MKNTNLATLTSVAISGNVIVAGAPQAYQFFGATFVYVKPAGGWNKIGITETARLVGYHRAGSAAGNDWLQHVPGSGVRVRHAVSGSAGNSPTSGEGKPGRDYFLVARAPIMMRILVLAAGE